MLETAGHVGCVSIRFINSAPCDIALASWSLSIAPTGTCKNIHTLITVYVYFIYLNLCMLGCITVALYISMSSLYTKIKGNWKGSRDCNEK